MAAVPKPGAPIDDKKHTFWETQPVPQVTASTEIREQLKKHVLTAKDFTGAPLETKTVAEIPTEPYPVASVLEWFNLDINNPKEVDMLYTLLLENYVEDDDSLFRFEYSRAFLKWALTPPGYYKDWHVGVRKKETKEIVAFISGVPTNIKVGEKTIKLCEINFLCVSKRLRDKRLAPILIKEVTRRVNLCDIWQAIYTAGRDIPTPISAPRYFHRSLNPEKLIDIGFSRLPDNFTRFDKPMEAFKRSIALEAANRVTLRKMTEEDLPAVMELLKKQLHNSSAVSPDFDMEELKHWMITNPKDQIVFAYVKEDPKSKMVTDFVSFYHVSSQVLQNPRHNTLKAAYCYYYANTTVDLVKLFNEALHLAKDLGFDVFNALNIMENEKFIEPLRFGPGDGYLRYYLFNWKLTTIQCAPEHIGVVML